jgi:hypothetical protein
MTDENMQPAPPPPQPAQTPQSFFSALLDVRFGSYITPKVVTVLYVLGMIGIVIGYLTFTVIMFNANAAAGFVTLLIIGPLFALLALIWLRVTLEFYLALVRLSGDFKEWREEWRQRTA